MHVRTYSPTYPPTYPPTSPPTSHNGSSPPFPSSRHRYIVHVSKPFPPVPYTTYRTIAAHYRPPPCQHPPATTPHFTRARAADPITSLDAYFIVACRTRRGEHTPLTYLSTYLRTAVRSSPTHAYHRFVYIYIYKYIHTYLRIGITRSSARHARQSHASTSASAARVIHIHTHT